MHEKKSLIVKRGYTKIAEKYDRKRDIYPNKGLLLKITTRLPKTSRILDLGCGAGIPVTKFLADNGYVVTGIDFSEGMLKLARKNVRKAKFIKMDMTKMDFPPNYFNGAVSFYAIIHVPREKHKRMYKTLHKILKNNAVMMINAGSTKAWEGTSENYFGVPMFWSSYSPNKTLRIIRDSGFDVIWSKLLKLGGEKQFWVLARNKK